MCISVDILLHLHASASLGSVFCKLRKTVFIIYCCITNHHQLSNLNFHVSFYGSEVQIQLAMCRVSYSQGCQITRAAVTSWCSWRRGTLKNSLVGQPISFSPVRLLCRATCSCKDDGRGREIISRMKVIFT